MQNAQQPDINHLNLKHLLLNLISRICYKTMFPSSLSIIDMRSKDMKAFLQ